MVKKKWSRPECNKVKLIPEETVITGCKTTGTVTTGKIANCNPTWNCHTASS